MAMKRRGGLAHARTYTDGLAQSGPLVPGDPARHDDLGRDQPLIAYRDPAGGRRGRIRATGPIFPRESGTVAPGEQTLAPLPAIGTAGPVPDAIGKVHPLLDLTRRLAFSAACLLLFLLFLSALARVSHEWSELTGQPYPPPFAFETRQDCAVLHVYDTKVEVRIPRRTLARVTRWTRSGLENACRWVVSRWGACRERQIPGWPGRLAGPAE